VAEFFKKACLFLLILFFAFWILDKYYGKRILLKKDDKGIWIQSFKNKTFDYAVIGSSRAFNVFSINIADSVLGKKGINLAIGGAAYPENLLSLHAFLEKGNKIRNIFIQVDMWGLLPPDSSYSHPFTVYRYLHLIGRSPYDKIIQNNSEPVKFYFRKYLPFFGYAEFNNIFPLNEVVRGFKLNEHISYDKEMGSQLLTKNEVQTIGGEKQGARNRPLSETSKKYLIDLVQLCRKNNIKVFFFTSPSKAAFIKDEMSNDLAHRKIDSISVKYNIRYLNLEADTMCYNDHYFVDQTHVNSGGAAILTHKVSIFMKPYLQ
jgi:hypothetical protein